MEQQIRFEFDDYTLEEPIPIVVEDHRSGSNRTDSNSTDTESDSDSVSSGTNKRSSSQSEASESGGSESDSDCESEMAESDSAVGDQFGVFSRNGMMSKLNEVSEEFENIVKSFCVGMGTAAAVTEVLAVHKNLVSGIVRRARFASFRAFSEAMKKKCGGNPNFKYAWFGGSKEEIADILVHGFSSVNGDEFGRIQLCPVRFGLDQAMDLEVGDDGMRHLMLCRVILGKVEEVLSESKQIVPSSKEFDIGVDSAANPRKFYVWSPFMNSHICPAFVVSFKGPASLKGYVTGITTTQAPSIATARPVKRPGPGPFGHVTLPALVAGLTRFLTPREMKIVVRLLDDFRTQKINGDDLKRKVKLIAGDKLMSAMKLVSGRGSGAFGGLQLENGSVRDIYLPGLITVLGDFLPASKMDMLSKSLADFRAKKINRAELARSVRVIVGDDSMLVAAINSYRTRKQQDKSLMPSV